MERDRNVYRLHSTPDIVLKLGTFPVGELVSIRGGLFTQRQRIEEDISYVEAEIGRRQPPVDAESMLAAEDQVEAAIARQRDACVAEEEGKLFYMPTAEVLPFPVDGMGTE